MQCTERTFATFVVFSPRAPASPSHTASEDLEADSMSSQNSLMWKLADVSHNLNGIAIQFVYLSSSHIKPQALGWCGRAVRGKLEAEAATATPRTWTPQQRCPAIWHRMHRSNLEDQLDPSMLLPILDGIWEPFAFRHPFPQPTLAWTYVFCVSR